MRLRDKFWNHSRLLSLAVLASVLAGCGTPSPTTDAPVTTTEPAPKKTEGLRTDPLRAGDGIRIDFSGTPDPIPYVETEIKGDGMVRLDLIGNVQAEGKTPGELEREIQSKYVPSYYTHLTVTVTPQLRYFYVEGDVNQSGTAGRVAYNGPITVTRAIVAAGGFDDFANRRKVMLYRVDGTIIKVNCIKILQHPDLDPQVYPGDKIFVPKRLF